MAYYHLEDLDCMEAMLTFQFHQLLPTISTGENNQFSLYLPISLCFIM